MKRSPGNQAPFFGIKKQGFQHNDFVSVGVNSGMSPPFPVNTMNLI